MTEPRRAVPPWWPAYEILAMGLGLGLLAVLCLIWMPISLLIHLTVPQRIAQPLGRRAIALGFRVYLWLLERLCLCRFDLAALDALREEHPLIVAANHPSLLDAVMIVSRLPEAVCVMKASLMDNILFGAAARLARYIRNDAPLKMILDARDNLTQGAHLLIFPEGSRTRRFPVDRCLPSVGLISARAGVPIQTVLIACSTPYLGRDWPLFRRPQLPLTFSLRLGRRFNPPTDLATFARDLESSFRDSLSTTPQGIPA
ncbi:MAG: 1-acyl-sn-glycerol-3-phosphate acyltransferase [Zoogloeaceae bacterium]|nr:1-acyl-sn-glycerol-3-phosphate acyltransferase [Zoogloeaceae bacterium]